MGRVLDREEAVETDREERAAGGLHSPGIDELLEDRRYLPPEPDGDLFPPGRGEHRPGGLWGLLDEDVAFAQGAPAPDLHAVDET